MKVIVTAGGTGGHIYPALGVIEELQKKKVDILYIGTNDRMESKLVPEKGIDYIGIDATGLSKNVKKSLKALKQSLNGYKKCISIMKEYKPDYVIGFGGYVTFPVLMAARKLNVRTGIHEQNKIPGKTNKILSRFTDTTFSSFEADKGTYKNNVIISGNPCASKAMKAKAHDKTKLGFSNKKKLIIIVMGSLGSKSVNDKIKDFLVNFKSKNEEILFISGAYSYPLYKDLKVPKAVKIVPFYNDLSALIKVSDLVISRAGASTISELLALDIPSILIPSPYVANNHQYYNALDLEEKGKALMLEEKDLNTLSLKEKIEEAFLKYDVIKDNLKKGKKIDASKVIVNEILK